MRKLTADISTDISHDHNFEAPLSAVRGKVDMAFFALILDEELNASDNLVRLVATNTRLGQLKKISSFDPNAPHPQIVRSAFTFNVLSTTSLRGVVTGSAIPASLCKVNSLGDFQ